MKCKVKLSDCLNNKALFDKGHFKRALINKQESRPHTTVITLSLGVCAASTAALPVVKVVYIERCYQRHGSRDGPADTVIQKKTAEENAVTRL